MADLETRKKDILTWITNIAISILRLAFIYVLQEQLSTYFKIVIK